MPHIRPVQRTPDRALARRGIRSPVPADITGIAASRLLPDREAWDAWNGVLLPAGDKERLLRQAEVTMNLRPRIGRVDLPLHGLILLAGEPGVGKTTLGRGLGAPLAEALGAEILFIEVDNHELVSSGLGGSQKAVDRLFDTTIAEAATGGRTLVLIDEVEALVTSRAHLSFETNPADVHRAVDAALTGLDNVARAHDELLIVATTNFAGSIDAAFLSRADYIYSVPKPDHDGRQRILSATLRAVADVYSDAARLLDAGVIDRVAAAADGLDARQLRKSVAVACALDDETARDPGKLNEQGLIAAIAAMKVEP